MRSNVVNDVRMTTFKR